MLCVVAQQEHDDTTETNEKHQEKTKETELGTGAGKEDELYATSKGKGKGKISSKGYGECWHCGERGHPRRECPHLNDPAKATGSIGALKGGKGKGKKAEGGKGKGKNGVGKGYGYQYGSPSKGVGKGHNQMDTDWYIAWGSECSCECDYYQDDCNNWDSQGGGIGSVVMMLEKGEKKDKINKFKNTPVETKMTGDFDQLKNTRRAEPIITCNRFEAFTTDDDSEDEIEDATGTTSNDACVSTKQKHWLNKRQRRRHKEHMLDALLDNTTTTTRPQQLPQHLDGIVKELSVDEPERDAAASINTLVHNGSIDDNIHRHSTKYMQQIRDKAHRRQAQYKRHNDMTDMNNTTSNIIIIITTWLKTFSNECSNCHWDGPQTSRVDCRSKLLHWPSSQRRCCNCVDSSGLSAEFVSQACERVNPREWELRGDDDREVMSPAQGSPPAKLVLAPRPLCQIADGTGFLQGQDVLRSSLAPSPSTGTCPSPIEGRGTQERWRAVGQKDIAAKANAANFTKFGAISSGSIPAECQAQAQRCSSRGSCADSAARVVAANRVHQGARGRREVMPPSEKPPRPISQRDGYRTGREEQCLQSTKCTHPIVRGRWWRGGAEAIALPLPSQLRGVTGVSGQSQSGDPTPKPRTLVCRSPSTIHHQFRPGTLPIIEGFEPYMKEVEDENEQEKWKSIKASERKKRQEGSQNRVQNTSPIGGYITTKFT